MHAVVDLSMTGRIAQFGGPIVADIAKQLVVQFGQNIQKELLAPGRPSNNLAAKAAGSRTDGERPGSASAPAVAAEINLGKIAWMRLRPWIVVALIAVIGVSVLYFV